MELLDLFPHFQPEAGIEIRQRLVEQHHVRFHHQRPRQGDSLLLAARQLVGRPVTQALHLNHFQSTLDPPGPLVGRDLAHHEAVFDVLPDRHVRPEGVVLEHHPRIPLVGRHQRHISLIEQNPPPLGLIEPGNEAEQCRLAASRRAKKKEELTPLDVQTHPLDGNDVVEALRDPFKRDTDHRRPLCLYQYPSPLHPPAVAAAYTHRFLMSTIRSARVASADTPRTAQWATGATDAGRPPGRIT